MSLFAVSIYYRLLHDLRVKQAIFFSTAFPLLLFVLFTSIWGGSHDQEYNYRLLTGIVGATLTSEGLYAIGAVVRTYFESKLIRFFRVTPVNITLHFLSIVISRLIFLGVTALALMLLAFFMYGLTLSLQQMFFLGIGMIVGLTLFSALGLVISFADLKNKVSSGLVNFIYFILVFLSNAYYPLEVINPKLNQFANLLPVNHLLNLLRGTELWYSTWYCVIAVVLLAGVFSLLFSRYQLTR